MKTVSFFIVLAAFFGMLCTVIPYLPVRGNIDEPLHRETVSTGGLSAGHFYLKHSYEDAHTENVVTVVLADYRGFDTLGETIVVLTAGVACLLILGRRKAR